MLPSLCHVYHSVCVVPLEPQPSSLMETGPLTIIQGSTMLEVWLKNIKSQFRCKTVLAAVPPFPEDVKQIAKRCEVYLWSVRSQSPLNELMAILREFPAELLIVADLLLGCGVFPGDSGARLLEAHERSGLDITVTNDLPYPVFVGCFENRAAEMINTLPAGLGSFRDLYAMLLQLCNLSNIAEGATLCRMGHISGAQALSLKPDSTPRYIPCNNYSDLQRIALACQVEGSSGLFSSAMSTLKATLIRDLNLRNTTCRSIDVSLPSRILFASNPSAFSGSEQALLSSIAALSPSKSYELYALVAQKGLFTERLRQADVFTICPQRDFAEGSVRNLIYIAEMLGSIRPTIVHANAFVGNALPAWCKRHGIPFIQWLRLANCDALIDQLLASDMITAVSKFVARRLSTELVDCSKIRVLYDGIDTEYYRPASDATRAAARKRYNFSDCEFVICCVSRFVPYKRHDLLIRAFARAFTNTGQAKLILVGEADCGLADTMAGSRALVEQLGIGGDVLFTGFLRDAREILAAADCAIQCADHEPLGCSVLEAMASSIPVIASNSGGFPEMIEEGVEGLLFDPGQADALALQMQLLAKDVNKRRAMGDAGRARILLQFSLDVHYKNLARIYEEAISLAASPTFLPGGAGWEKAGAI